MNQSLKRRVLQIPQHILMAITSRCMVPWEKAYASNLRYYKDDVEKIVRSGPWYIDGSLLLLKRMNPNVAIDKLIFDQAKLWVRCFDLPPKAFSLRFSKVIDDDIGVFCESDVGESSSEFPKLSFGRVPSIQKYLRLKCVINLLAPLKRAQSIRIRNPCDNTEEEIIARLAYERLPQICFHCGIFGHTIEDCLGSGPILYGEWIRAEIFYRSNARVKKNMVSPAPPPSEKYPSSNNESTSNLRSSPISKSLASCLADPYIIKANYAAYRAEYPLHKVPTSNPEVIAIETANLDTVPACAVLVSSTNQSQPNSASHQLDFCVLGMIPGLSGKTPRLPNTNFSSLGSSNPSYFNPAIPHNDLFSPTTNRCLFQSNIVHPTLSSVKTLRSSTPPELIPLGNEKSFISMLEENQTPDNVNMDISIPAVEPNVDKVAKGRKRSSGGSLFSQSLRYSSPSQGSSGG